jgi:hypothetical protein
LNWFGIFFINAIFQSSSRNPLAIAVGLPVTQQPPHRPVLSLPKYPGVRYYRTGLFRQPRFRNTLINSASMLFSPVKFALLFRLCMSVQGFLYGLRLPVNPFPWQIADLHVIGPTVSEYYGLIRLPKGHQHPYNFSLRVRLPAHRTVVDKEPMHSSMAGTLRISQAWPELGRRVPGVSLHTCHALSRPRQTLGGLTKALSLYWLLEPLHHRHLHYPQ